MPAICLITALPSEARPLITHFKLRSVPHPHLKLYAGKDCYLLQTGLGKLNAAAATASMLQTLPELQAVINVGIAGSEQVLGTCLLAHHVQDAASGQQWYPHLPAVRAVPDLVTLSVCTVDTPASHYTPDTAFDMEASGIFTAACKTLDLAFVHSLKVVSDNSVSSIESITAETVANTINDAIVPITQLMGALPFSTLPQTTRVESLVQSLQSAIHYTQTEQHALSQLLLRHSALLGTLPEEGALIQLGNAKAIRQKLSQEIDQASVTY